MRGNIVIVRLEANLINDRA